jgi:hypothetical protein
LRDGAGHGGGCAQNRARDLPQRLHHDLAALFPECRSVALERSSELRDEALDRRHLCRALDLGARACFLAAFGPAALARSPVFGLDFRGECRGDRAPRVGVLRC